MEAQLCRGSCRCFLHHGIRSAFRDTFEWIWLGGRVLEGQQASAIAFHIAQLNLIRGTCRAYLEKYRTCKSSEEVAAMQDTILAELANSYEESRKDKDKGRFTPFSDDLWIIPLPYPIRRICVEKHGGPLSPQPESRYT